MPPQSAITPRRFASRAQLDAALVQRLVEALAAPVPGGAVIMLSGGSTPMPAYREVAARSPTPAPNLSVMFSDERYVPADSQASNAYQARALLSALALPAASVLRVRTELSLADAAKDYEQRIDALLLAGAKFTLGLLGLGADGHTASLFNGGDLERAKGRRAIAVDRPDGMQAISVTPEVLAHFSELLFVVAGAGKQGAVQSLLGCDPSLTAFRAIESRARTEVWLAEI